MTGPRVLHPKKGRDAAGNRAYMREYMRRYREGSRRVFKHEYPRQEIVSDAIYIPERDGPPTWANLTSILMGDPPLGRRALDSLTRQAKLQRSEA